MNSFRNIAHPTVFHKIGKIEPRLCLRCGSQMRGIDSTCWHCNGRKPPIEEVVVNQSAVKRRWTQLPDGTMVSVI